MGIENNKLDAKEMEAVSGGQIIEGKDGKFYVTVDDNLPVFNSKEDAEKAQILVRKVKERPFQPAVRPVDPFLPGRPPRRFPIIAKNGAQESMDTMRKEIEKKEDNK